MGNASGREGQVVPGAGGSVGADGGGHGNQEGNAHRLPQYAVPPSGHHHHHPNTIQDPTRIAQVASADSMGQSPSDSPGSAARSPLMFTPQVCHLWMMCKWSWKLDQPFTLCGSFPELSTGI